MCLGIPGKIVERFDRDSLPMGKVDFGGVSREVCLAYVPDAPVGSYVIVHVGFAISVLTEDEAETILQDLREIERLGAEP